MTRSEVAGTCILTSLLVLSLASFSWQEKAFGGEESSVTSSLIALQNLQPSRATVSSGEVVNLTGYVASGISVNMTVMLYLVSNGTEGLDWALVDMRPAEPFRLASEDVPFSFTVRFLTEGTFLVQPHARILEIPNRTVPIDASSPDCSLCKTRGSIVIVADSDAYVNLILVAGAITTIAVAGGIFSAWYIRHKRLSARHQ